MKHVHLFSFILLFFSLEAEQFSDVFKPLSVAYLNDLFDCASPEKQEELNQYFHVKKIIGARPGKNKHIISYSLFWKPPHTSYPLPTVTEVGIQEVIKFSRGTSSFYEYYVLPMINTIKKRAESHPKWVTRIYLAEDLEFLANHLQTETQAEIFIMSSSSIAHNPGAMWRFLAFDDREAYFVYVNDSDENLNSYIDHQMVSWLNNPKTQGWFRVTTLQFRENLKECIYTPIFAGFFGYKNVQNLNFNMEKTIKGFILHRQLFPDEERHPRDISYPNHPYGFGNEFPSYGFDERFLKHVIYYDAAYKGALTLLPPSNFERKNAPGILQKASPTHLVLMDIEFVRMYNPLPIYGVNL